MRNMILNVYAKFNYDRLRINKALGITTEEEVVVISFQKVSKALLICSRS